MARLPMLEASTDDSDAACSGQRTLVWCAFLGVRVVGAAIDLRILGWLGWRDDFCRLVRCAGRASVRSTD